MSSPAGDVMEILGHSQIALTMNTYSHVAPEVSWEAVGAENLCHLGRCLADGDRLDLALDVGRPGLGLAGGGMIFSLWA